MIEAIIHVHNRTLYLERAVEAAVLSAASTGAVIKVSSNASNEVALSTAHTIAQKHKLEFTQSYAVTAFDHFRNSVISSEARYITLLHDDDFVALQYFHILLRLISARPDAVAYAPDADFMIKPWTHSAAIRPAGAFRISPKWLALLYYLGRCGPPFPCILYRRHFALDAFSITPAFGKYSDTIIVLEAAKLGLWIDPESAFTYVSGTQNDSGVVDIHARQQLRRWLLRKIVSLNSGHWSHLPSNLLYFLGRFAKRRLAPM